MWQTANVLVFIDESGCAGFKLARGSTPYFVVAMVVFEDHDEANRVDGAIDSLRAPIRHKAEFKFSKCRNDVRDAIQEALVPWALGHSDPLKEQKKNSPFQTILCNTPEKREDVDDWRLQILRAVERAREEP